MQNYALGCISAGSLPTLQGRHAFKADPHAQHALSSKHSIAGRSHEVQPWLLDECSATVAVVALKCTPAAVHSHAGMLAHTLCGANAGLHTNHVAAASLWCN
jgi:hypothetical protein